MKCEENNLDNNKYDRASFFWNMMATVVYSAQSPVLLLFVTRIIGLHEAGVFAITYTLAHMFTNVGLYSVRNYQVSDVRGEYKFSDYYTTRILTILTMIIVCMGYAIMCNYDWRKAQLAFLWIIYRSIESIEDVYHGEVQKKGRLDIVSEIVFIRITASMIIFLIFLLITKDLLYATVSLVISSIIIYLFSNRRLKQDFAIEVETRYKNIVKIIYTCFPVFVSSFLYSYFVNAPKYAIDAYLTSEMQSIFTIIFLPNMVINMIGMFVYKPLIVKISEIWNNNKVNEFKTLILKQAVLLAMGGLVLVIGGTIVGLPVLEVVYGVDLNDYVYMFALLLFFGSISALNNYFSVIITIMRKQKYLMLAYGIGFIACMLVNNYAVRNYMLMGATWSFGIIVLSMLFILIGIIVRELIVSKRKRFN